MKITIDIITDSHPWIAPKKEHIQTLIDVQKKAIFGIPLNMYEQIILMTVNDILRGIQAEIKEINYD